MQARIWKFTKKTLSRLDPILLTCTLLLSFISIITIIGAVDNFGKSKLVMQVAMTFMGIIMTIIVANIDYEKLVDNLWIIMIIGSVALLGITLIFGNSGASRDTANKSWLMIPFINISIQPSEFIKITFICTFSKHLSMVKEKINQPKVLLPLALHAGAIVGLILLSGDLGVALVYICVIALMLFCNGLSLWYFLGAAVLVALLSPFMWEHLSNYQQARIIYGFQPELDPEFYGFQPLLSRTAIASGGLFGKGLFTGGYYEVLPASHTDFIYATVCEKFGYIGGLSVMIIFIVMVVRLIAISLKARKQMGALICLGIAAVIIVQTLENIGMCLAMLPVVGITLPFLSCGGSSMLATFILAGLAHSVASHNKKYYFERESD